MSMTHDKIKIGLLGLSGLLALILLITLFKGHNKDNFPYKELIAAKDSVIQSLKHERETIEAELIERQISLDALETLDSVTYAHYREFQKIHKLLDDKLKNISVRISSVANNNDSLRRLVSEF